MGQYITRQYRQHKTNRRDTVNYRRLRGIELPCISREGLSSDTGELMIHESLLISKLKPSLNVQGSSIPLNLL